MPNLVNPNTNINRPLSPHLTIHKPQFTPTFSIYHRISGAFLATMVSFSPLFGPEIVLISLTYENLYQLASGFSVNFPKFTLSLVNLTSLAPRYHMGNGVRHLWWDWGFIYGGIGASPIIRISEFPTLCVASCIHDMLALLDFIILRSTNHIHSLQIKLHHITNQSN